MTPEMFMGWLEGYLEAAGDGLTQDDIKKIQKKMKKVVNQPNITINPQPIVPQYPTYPDANPDWWRPQITWCESDNKIEIKPNTSVESETFWKV